MYTLYLQTNLYILCFGCLFICLYPINFQTAEPIGSKVCVEPHMTPRKVFFWSKFQKFTTNKIQFWLIFLYPRKNLSNHSLGCLERWKFSCMIIEGPQYVFGESYWRTKPRDVRNDYFAFYWKRPINLKNFNFDKTFCSGWL